MTLRKIATLLVGAGLTLGIIGPGIGAQFTDGASATMSIEVGTFGIEISSEQGTVVGNTVTCAADPILSSAPGNRPCIFKVTNVGTMPATLTVSASLTGGTARFHDMFDSYSEGAPQVISSGLWFLYDSGGISWDQLINDDLGRTVSVTYTVTATG